jgi:hypothetical protein
MSEEECVQWQSFNSMQAASSPTLEPWLGLAAKNVVRVHLAVRMLQELEWEEGREAY